MTYACEYPIITCDTPANVAVSFTDFVLWIVRMYASAEMTMNSVERVGECE